MAEEGEQSLLFAVGHIAGMEIMIQAMALQFSLHENYCSENPEIICLLGTYLGVLQFHHLQLASSQDHERSSMQIMTDWPFDYLYMLIKRQTLIYYISSSYMH